MWYSLLRRLVNAPLTSVCNRLFVVKKTCWVVSDHRSISPLMRVEIFGEGFLLTACMHDNYERLLASLDERERCTV